MTLKYPDSWARERVYVELAWQPKLNPQDPSERASFCGAFNPTSRLVKTAWGLLTCQPHPIGKLQAPERNPGSESKLNAS